jgi:hypothetical protein
VKKKPSAPAQFWIIDTDSPGENRGSFSTSGPYPTRKAAEDHIIADHKAIWKESCNCLKHNSERAWAGTQIIVQTVRTVIPTPSYSLRMNLKTTTYKKP